ncbi:FAD-binding oxidoreductase [Nocardioides ungokensis]|uniref:FAD-binding oxidoreductase n=1 Tax=Nocardioides ungokensis TaxID=1643322 RepID=UPI0015DFE386|nr:FAD-binding oxidoreductase [Nocardioides ungokensis]
MTVSVATLTGTEAQIDEESLEELRMMVRGDVLTRNDPGYAAVRRPYNAMHPGTPSLVVRPTGTADVVVAVNFARSRGLVVAVRGGGHSIAGLSSVDGGMLLDLGRMDGVDVDPDARTVRAQGGALIGDMDHETQAFGLVAPSGIVSDTGVAGLTLGGGEGWVRRKYGLSVDNLLSAQVVGADGQVRTASADSNPDLFWALRGGGGNFGVVTSFTFRCHPVGPIVAFAGVFHPAEDAENVYPRFRDWAQSAPDEISALIGCTTLPASENTPPEIHNRPFIVTGALYTGDPLEGMKIIQPLREIGTPLADISGPLPFVAVQAAFDEFYQRGTLRSYWKSTYVEELTDPVLDLLVDRALNRPHDRVFVVAFQMGGAINRVGAQATPYSERSANWMVSIDGNWLDASDDDRVISWFATHGPGCTR